MEIKTYKKLRGNIYQVTMDDGKKYKLYDDIILRYELLIDKHLDDKKMEKVLLENGEMDAYYKAVKYLGVKMRSELELRKYLKKYEIPNKAVNETIDKLKKAGYLNQNEYAEAYVNDSLNLGLNGPKKIRDNLVHLGIADECIGEYLNRIDGEVWRERIEKILTKKSKTNKVGIALFKNKMYSELSMLGYYSEDIKNVLDDFTCDTSDAFMKEANKIYDKLAVKYEGTELELRFKAKMYAKGFESDMISDYLKAK